MTKTINLDDYKVNKLVLIGIVRIIDEYHNMPNVKDVFTTSNPEIIRFIDDCYTALNY